DLYAQILRLLPPGEAWQDLTAPDGTSVMHAFWKSIASEVYEMDQAACRVFDEFFATTMSVDEDLWLAEFSLPDECDPFGTNILAKIRATAGDATNPDFYVSLAEQMGYSIAARWLRGDDVEYPGIVSTLLVTVDPSMSLAMDLPVIGTMVIG